MSETKYPILGDNLIEENDTKGIIKKIFYPLSLN